MERRVIIASCMDRTVTALQEDGKIVELCYSPEDAVVSVGDIYVGKVKQVLPNIKGAFVDIGNTECYIGMEGNLCHLKTGQELPVQIQKEGNHIKKPTVTTNLSFAGQYVVVTSENKVIGVSSKIPLCRKEELRELGEHFRSEGMGIVFRTGAADAENEVICAELTKLLARLRHVLDHWQTRTCFSCLYQTPSREIQYFNQMLRGGLDEIVIEHSLKNGALYLEMKHFLETEYPESLSRLRCYDDPSYPLCKCYHLEKETEDALKQKVWLSSGAYLVIQSTEALKVIDVNSGKCQLKKHQFPEINQEAAREVARQIRLRNLSGIILIDFINMDQKGYPEELIHALQNELNKDPNAGKVVDITKLQLVEITRKKMYQSLEECLKRN